MSQGSSVDILEKTFADDFRQLLRSDIESKVIAVGVSGGADSMALALLLTRAIGQDHVIALCVDHTLRHGSAAEARWTQSQLKKHGLQCDILTLTASDLPSGNTQASARMARYRRMAAACAQYESTILCTAHTLDDQAETLLARLARGSGTKGLSAMSALADYPVPDNNPKLRLARPVLHMRRKALRQYLINVEQRWAEDPSNTDYRYDRIRLRAILSAWERAGFSQERIAMSAENMQRSEAALEYYAEQEMAKAVTVSVDKCRRIGRTKFLSLPPEIQRRLLMKTLKATSQNQTDLRIGKLSQALHYIQTAHPQRFTLHGCIVEVFQDDFTLTREKQASRR